MDDENRASEQRKPRSFTHESRYVLSVDGQRKASYQDAESAMAAGRKISDAFPRLNVSVQDQTDGTHSVLSAISAPAAK